jgi:hypothetical protein
MRCLPFCLVPGFLLLMVFLQKWLGLGSVCPCTFLLTLLMVSWLLPATLNWKGPSPLSQPDMVLCVPYYWLLFAMEVILLPREWQGTQELLNMNSEAAQWSVRDLQGCTKPPLDSTRCTSHWTPANREIPGQETVTYTHCSSISCPPILSIFFSSQIIF